MVTEVLPMSLMLNNSPVRFIISKFTNELMSLFLIYILKLEISNLTAKSLTNKLPSIEVTPYFLIVIKNFYRIIYKVIQM